MRSPVLGAEPRVLAAQAVNACRANLWRSLVVAVIAAACASACFLETYLSASAARADEATERLSGRDVVRVEAPGLPTEACTTLARADGVDSTVGVRHLGTVMVGTPAEREVTVEAVTGSLEEFFHVPASVAEAPVLIGSDLSDTISADAASHTLLLPQLPAAGGLPDPAAPRTPEATGDRTPVQVRSVVLPQLGRSLGSSLLVKAGPVGTVDACLVSLAPPVDPQAPAMLQGMLGSRATVSGVAWLTAARPAVLPQDRYSARIGRYAPWALALVVALVDVLQVRSRRREFALYRVNGVNGSGVLFMRFVECALLGGVAVAGWSLSLSILALAGAGDVDLSAARLGVQSALGFTLIMLGTVPILGALGLRSSPWEMLREP